MAAAGEPQDYDLLSLGSGEAGKYIAWTLSSSGKRVAVIENRYLGGSCPNTACLPSKNVIYSAKVSKIASEGRTFGLPPMMEASAGSGSINMSSVKQRKSTMIDGLMKMHQENFQRTGAELIWGEGRFVGPKTIEVTDANGNKKLLRGKTVVVSTGSRARIDPIPGLKEAEPLTHIEILELEEVPRHLIVLGGGYVGLEFAQAMRRFGSKVTIVERNLRALKNEDEDVARLLVGALEDEGIKFETSTVITAVSGSSGSEVLLKGTRMGEPFELLGSHILCATGRIPNTENIGAEKVGIKLTERGFIAVNEVQQTSVEGVFAVGDCSGSPHFTHVAYDDFRIVRDHLGGEPSIETRRSSRQVPSTLFTSPELAHVGLREREAQAQGIAYRLAKLPMEYFLQTRTIGETQGFAKALISNEDDTILGFTALGPKVGELLPVVQLAMKNQLPYTDIASLIITHPTLSEGLVFLFSAVPAKSK